MINGLETELSTNFDLLNDLGTKKSLINGKLFCQMRNNFRRSLELSPSLRQRLLHHIFRYTGSAIGLVSKSSIVFCDIQFYITVIIDTWPDYKRDNCLMKTNMLLESYFKKDMILHYRGRNTKSLHSNLEKIGTSMRVDAGEMER